MPVSRSIPVLAGLVMAIVFHAGDARGDAAQGAQIAQQWCAACHAVGRQRGATPDTAPPFSAMANDPAYTRERITGFLWSPHPPMPQLDLTQVQVNALADYIQSLRGN